MKPQETKFEFVYNEIKQCILDGQIPHGNALPSSRMYCEQFHVSRYTTVSYTHLTLPTKLEV